MFKFDMPWFPEWNQKNPRDVYGPAILMGAAGGAVVVAVVLMLYGKQVATTSDQTGPAGTGMHQPKFNSDRAAVDPTVEAYGDLTPSGDLLAAMRAWTGIPDLLEDPDNYQSKVALKMLEMTWNINTGWDGHVGEGGVNCYTCHRGQAVPSGIWFKVSPGKEAMSGWAANQNLATAQTVSTSLPHDALEKLLLEDGQIAVHDLEPRVPSNPSDPEDRTWQDTERTFSLMNYFANSLGQNCTFCHNSRAFYDGAEVTPQWATASLGIEMVRELNQEYLVPLAGEYPPNRLGPKHGDAPKAACLTCHKGANKPLGGMDMVADWPQFTGDEPPSVE